MRGRLPTQGGGRGRPRPPPSPTPHDAWVFGVDPGATSGWALLHSGTYVAGGVVWEPRAVRGTVLHEVLRAVDDRCGDRRRLVAVIERWGVGGRMTPATYGGLEASAQRWIDALLEAGHPLRRTRRVHTATWSRAVLGSARLTTGARRVRSILAAQPIVGRRLGAEEHDLAAAVCIAKWGSHAGEVAAVLPRRRRTAS